MSVDPTKCPECGARVKDRDATFCQYCGTKLPDAGRPPAPGPLGDVDRRLDELMRRPETAALMKHTPSSSSHRGGIAAQGVFFLLFAVIALFIMFMGGKIDTPGPSGTDNVFVIVPIAFAAIGIGGFLFTLLKGTSFSRSRLARLAAAIAGERTRVSGGGGNSHARTTYYVTLQGPGGRRHEFDASDRVSGMVTTGDVGIAYVKAGVLLDFKRVRV
jgi:hypothetical protein